ncbi:MAG: hypothetical protein DSM106950_26620 [Stigonema ocellatum SAG 48.90 = DSM 106950]|nr:hypothetical protein [Stigonema ocellatum SAG 48.90 = DSM 106950]
MHCVLVRDRPCGQLLIASTSGSATGEDWAAKRSAGCGLQKSRVANTKSW